MKKILLVLLVLISVMALAETVTVLGPWAGQEMDKFTPVLEAFEAKTGIDVKYQTYRAEDLANLLPAQFAAKKAPGDVVFMWPSFIVKNEDKVIKLNEIVDPADYLPGALNNVSVGKDICGFAYTAKVKPGFWYRKSYFVEHGLTAPKTWDEFIALLEEIEKIEGIKAPIASGGSVGWVLSDITEHFLISFGGPELQQDLIAGNIKWDSYTVRRAMEKLDYLLARNFFSEPAEWTTILKQWWKGEYGIYFMGSWITGMVDDPNDLGVFSLPNTNGMVFGMDYAFVPKYAKNVEAAKKLVAYLASAEGQSVQVSQGGHIATVLGVPAENYPPVDSGVAALIEGVATLNDLDDSIGGIWQPTFWDQLKLLWVKPDKLDSVLMVLDEKMPD